MELLTGGMPTLSQTIVSGTSMGVPIGSFDG